MFRGVLAIKTYMAYCWRPREKPLAMFPHSDTMGIFCRFPAHSLGYIDRALRGFLVNHRGFEPRTT